ncbi:MAG: YihY/virulence factor BrkB family protein [Candidatus Limnocylindrales bacterium]
MSSSGWYRRFSAPVARHGGRRLLDILARYDAAGGSLLAGGLAYSALFAIVPLALLAAGLTGLLVSEPGVRSQVVLTIADVLPPLRGLLQVVLDEAARSAAAISIVGAVTLAWGGSRFVIAFETAMSRIAGGARTRGVLHRNLIGLVTAVVLVATVMLGAILAGVAAFLDAAAAENQVIGLSLVARVVLEALPLILAIGAMALVYRFVPEGRPSWGATWVPAVAIGVVLSISARLFVFIAPRLIGAAATIGSLATVFAALAWLGLTFQAILLGAAWVGDRQGVRIERERLAGAS